MPVPRRESDKARVPNIEDVRSAYFSGKLATEEANDLAGSNRFYKQIKPAFGGGPVKYESTTKDHSKLDNEARKAHKKAGLSE